MTPDERLAAIVSALEAVGVSCLVMGGHADVMTEKFPAYAPTLNPDEGVWGWTKYGRLANLVANDTDELRDYLFEELVTAKHSPDLLNGFVRQTKLPGLSLAAD